ncbi:hypothetical protein HMPREF0573_10249 [Mobiluncus curtisii ATCC 43063]|uniref:Uncharacterized protein n=1 Tax=Mobiluncus curtisii (strain ATCC 43063 / DSM 2711 / V125) TaxID=548479 RepID=D6ZIL9_MOBCV|nr:hypothetical protein HMPREF0573_10249 [Mobiluncus curtisii ATCC 43063]
MQNHRVVVPALAGMSLRFSTNWKAWVCGPRTRGDEPEQDTVRMYIQEWSPHSRG